jgi:single-stranded-DNA-specific exonuclease
VAFKLVQALLARRNWTAEKQQRVAESFLKLVAIATVADVVPLTGENRVIVTHGLAGLGTVRNPGLRALLDVAGFPQGTVPSARQVAFQIAPRINAAGRMDTAQAVVDMFLTSDMSQARELAKQLHDHNTDRQQIEAEVRVICEQIAVDESAAALVYYNEKWHRGVIGIVASRLVERFHRPVFVLGHNAEDGLAQGSGRSIPAFHLLAALESMPDLFLKFGGHEHAAVVTLDPARVDEFRARFNAYAAGLLTPEDFIPELSIDAAIDLTHLNERSIDDVFSLAPFGHGNPAPVFAALNAEVAGTPAVWNEKHLKVAVRHNGRTLSVKAWNFAERLAEFPAGARVDIAFTIEEDSYSAARGYPGWAAILKDVREASGAGLPARAS